MKKKKLLVPSFDFKPALGGVANYVHEILNELHKQGDWEIKVIARNYPDSSTYDQSAPFSVRRLSTPQMAILALPFWIKAIHDELKNFQPDVILCPLWFPDAAATKIALTILGKDLPYHIVVHAMEILESRSTLKHQLRSIFLQKIKLKTFTHAKNIFCVSDFTKNLLLEQFPQIEKKTWVTKNGVNLDVYKKQSPPSDLQRKYKGRKILLTVSRLQPYKGVDKVLESLPVVIQKIPNLLYLIIGKGNDLSRLQKITVDLNLSAHVLFLGPLPQTSIIDHYNMADLFIMMSRQEESDVEGFGLVFLEAAACGLPSMGGNSGGIPDAIEDGKTGWLVDPQNCDLISEKIISILTQPPLLDTAKNQCLQSSSQKSWQSIATNLRGYLYE